MQHTLRRLAEGALLVSVCVALGCGGGSGSWGFQAEEGDWLVDMTIQTSGCAPTIMRQFHADVVALNSSRSALVIYLRTFYDCPIGEWNLPGTWMSSTYLDMDNHEDTFVCQFADRWGIGRFTVRSFSLDFPGGGGAFSGSGSFSGSIDGAMCDGTIAFVGVQPQETVAGILRMLTACAVRGSSCCSRSWQRAATRARTPRSRPSLAGGPNPSGLTSTRRRVIQHASAG